MYYVYAQGCGAAPLSRNRERVSGPEFTAYAEELWLIMSHDEQSENHDAV